MSLAPLSRTNFYERQHNNTFISIFLIYNLVKKTKFKLFYLTNLRSNLQYNCVFVFKYGCWQMVIEKT